jgi:inosose dehydratase
VRVGSAPVSWGVFEVESGGAQLPWPRVLDEIAAAGYRGTELGPWGYLPADPDRLGAELRRRGLALASAFHPLAPRGDAAGELARAEQTAATLAALGCEAIVLACAQTPDRAGVAGRVRPADALSGPDWDRYVDLVRRAAEAAAARGLRAHFHHHAATYVETPDEIDRLLDAVPPETLGLCLDTGHYAFGGGDPSRALARYGQRVGYVHLKDVRSQALADARASGLSFMEAVGADVFCELGRGDAGVEAVVRDLAARGYQGWCIVEQDRIVDASTLPEAPFASAQVSRAFLRDVLGR